MSEKQVQKEKRKPLPKPGRKQSFKEAVDATLKQYDRTFAKLAK